MKKHGSLAIILIHLIVLMSPLYTFAESASASLSGPREVRAGDTVTLSFNLNGTGIYGVSGSLSYDSSQITLSGTSQKVGSPWAVEFNGNNFVAYDNDLSNPINGKVTLFTLTFKVKSVSAGTDIKISYNGVTVSDGNADTNVGTVTYSVPVAAPLSANNNLANLTVSNATISPSFSANMTNYTAIVPFEVSKLNLSAAAVDGKAKITVDSPNLIPNGTTNVTVTVTAENGAKKTYTIAVTRAQDPNYVASSDNTLSGITVEGFLLSPGFTPENTRYVIWLPYETENIKISGSPADGKASVTVEGGESLLPGQDNTVKVICTAENGETKEYVVTVKRASAHDGSDKEFPLPSDMQQSDTNISTDGLSEISTERNFSDLPSSGIAWWLLIVAGISGIFFGIGIGYLIFKRHRKNAG